MFKAIYKAIKNYDTIVIARHVGVDPDAMASQIGLRDSILLTFPEKKVLAVGNGSNKFNYLGKLDKLEDIDFSKSSLIPKHASFSIIRLLTAGPFSPKPAVKHIISHPPNST